MKTPAKHHSWFFVLRRMSIRVTKALITFLLIISSFTLGASNVMTLSNPQVDAAQVAIIEVDISNDDLFVAFQFDLQMNEQISYVNNSAILDPARKNGHDLSVSIIPGNILRIIAYSVNNTPFNGNSGTVLSFELQTGYVPGVYSLNPINPIIGNDASQNILTSAVSGSVTILAPDISLSAGQLNFGEIPLTQSVNRNLTVYNTGNQPLQVSNITFNSPYFLVIGNTAFTINAGSSHMVTVRFESVVKGLYQKQMTIHSNDPDEATINVDLNALAFAVNELHCGTIFAYSDSEVSLTFSINNMEPFTGFQFDLLLPSPLTYLQGSVSLSGRKAGHDVAATMISSNILRVVAYSITNTPFSGDDGIVLTLGFNVFGTGGYYPLQLSNVVISDAAAGNIMSAYYNGNLQVAAPDIHANTQLAFGHVSVLETASLNLRVHNYGSDTLFLNQFQITNNAFWTTQVLPDTILVSNYKDITVNYHMPNKGDQQGVMKIFSNDPDENPYHVNLSAHSFAPNYFLVKDTTAWAYDTASIEIVANHLEDFIAFDLNLHFPEELIFLPDPHYTHLTGRAEDHQFHAAITEPGKLRVVAFSLSEKTFSGKSGALARIGFKVNTLTGGYSLPLVLSDIIMGGSNGQNIIYDWQNGTIEILTPAFPPLLELHDIIVSAEKDTCFAATHTIEVSDFMVESGGIATLVAGYNIVLHPGTKVMNGGKLHAFIDTAGEFCGSEEKQFLAYQHTDNFFRVYPNPTTASFTLELLDYEEPSIISIEIYNMLGNKILSTKLPAQPQYNFSLSGQQQGIYLVRVTKGNEVGVMKLIKQ